MGHFRRSYCNRATARGPVVLKRRDLRGCRGFFVGRLRNQGQRLAASNSALETKWRKPRAQKRPTTAMVNRVSMAMPLLTSAAIFDPITLTSG
jgi:hypothetical protein